MKKIIVLILSLSLIFSALPVNAQTADLNISKERRNIEKIIFDAEREAMKSVNNNQGRLLTESKIETSVLNNILTKSAEKYNIKLVSEPVSDGISVRGGLDSQHVDVRAPRVYSSSQGYVVTASAHWNDKYWMNHRSGFTQKVGGYDGIGIYFGRDTNIEVLDSSFHTCDNNGKWYNQSIYPQTINNAGVYYMAQDKAIGQSFLTIYTFDSVHISVWPSVNSSTDTWARTRFTHTWESAEITGVSISPGSIGVSISNLNYSWDGSTTSYCKLP